MRTKIARKRTMISAADTHDLARRRATDLVQHEIRRLGSKMRAYGAVARSVGVSESWVRKLIGRQPVVVAAHEFINLETARRRIERDAAVMKAAQDEHKRISERIAACEAALGLSSPHDDGEDLDGLVPQRRRTDRALAEGE